MRRPPKRSKSTKSAAALTFAATLILAATAAAPSVLGAIPQAVSVSPASGNGLGPQLFSYTFSDADGATNIRQAQVIIANANGSGDLCFIYVWASYPTPHVYLSSNNAYQPNTNGPIGSSTPLTSNACAIQLSASSASFSGNTFTLNLMITFQAAYAGNYTHWLWVDDWQGNTPTPSWDDFGAWTIPNGGGGGGGGPEPQLTSLTPTSGNTYGPQNFAFVFTDPQGANNVQQIQMMLGGPAAGCYAYIWVDSAWLYLADNSGNAWAGSGALGSASSPLSNSQCRINLVNSSQVKQGNNVTVTLNVEFFPAYGSATPRAWAWWADDKNGNSLGWNTASSTWTVPVGDTTPPNISNVSHSGITSSGATIAWVTNEASTTQVDYGTTTAYGSSTPVNNSLVANHVTSLTGLLQNTTYYYRVRSQDAAGNSSTQAPAGPFTTTSGTQTITSSPEGLTIRVDGVNCTTPCSGFLWTAGTSHTVTVDSPQTLSTSQYWFSYWSDGAAQSRTIVAPSTNQLYTASFANDPVNALRFCLNLSAASATCTLPVGQHTVNTPIFVSRNDVTIRGGSADRAASKLVRGVSNVDPIISLDAGNAVKGVTIRDLTICGSSTLNTEASPVGCPRTLTVCGQRTANPNNTQPLCEDMRVGNVDRNVAYSSNPFANTEPYSLTIDNVDFEDATGHALSLFNNASSGKKINDVFIRNGAFRGSEVTGILYGTTGTFYSPAICDANSNFKNDPSVFAPRNIRIEGNIFVNNNTGAMGGGAMRWVMLKDNTFTNNYRNPQGGNEVGGTIQFDPCADTVHIVNNTFTAPAFLNTDGMELYARNLLIQGNTLSGYGREGIGLHGVANAQVLSNTITESGSASFASTGGIMIATVESIQGPCEDPRDTNGVTVNGNTSQNQLFGLHFFDHDRHNRNTLSNITLLTNVFQPNSISAIGRDIAVVLNGYTGPTPTEAFLEAAPRVLPVKAVTPQTKRCTTGLRQTFAFPASGALGVTAVSWLQGILSTSGPASSPPGPNTGSQGCHFLYFRESNILYLDGPAGGDNWIGSSVIGPGGASISNGHCIVHAASSSVTLEPKILNLNLDLQFPASSSSGLRKHIYTISGDGAGGLSDGGTWKYWGWWETQ